MTGRDPRPTVAAGMPTTEHALGPAIRVSDLLAAIRDEFGRQAAPVPSRSEVHSLARVIAGHHRASSDVWPAFDELTGEQAVTSFVAAALSRWDPGDEDYPEVPSLVRRGFAQRGLPEPSEIALDTLARVALGFLRRRASPQDDAAQLAATDWVIALYRVPLEEEEEEPETETGPEPGD